MHAKFASFVSWASGAYAEGMLTGGAVEARRRRMLSC
jgi:hypothetical protein